MLRKTRRGRVWYTVSEPLEMEPGVVLPAGRYPGTMEQHGYVTYEEVDWAKPSYSMEVSASEMARMGKQVRRNDASFVCDITKHVRDKRVEIE